MEPIAANITEFELTHGERIYIAPTKAKDVVQVRGSLLGGWRMLPKEEEYAPSLAARLFDAGTKIKTKDQIREALSARGIDLSFSASGTRTSFSGTCLPEDLPFLMNTIVECLTEASFPAKEIALVKERRLAAIADSKNNTLARAGNALARALFDSNHPNYSETFEEQEQSIKRVTRAQIVSFQKMLGRDGLIVCITGDVHVSEAQKVVEHAIKKLPLNALSLPSTYLNKKKPAAQELLVPIKDKANIDTYLAAAIPMTIDHPLYIAARVFTSMLGGSGLSTGHLMRTIRERDGLTYGIRANLNGIGMTKDGIFQIWATFSPKTFEQAVRATRKEVKTFISSMLTSKFLLQKQDQLTGSYVVGLATTSGLANTIIANAEEGKPLSYIDAYPDLVRAVTVEDLKVVAKLIPFDKLSLAASGTFQK